jgi:hypothetical protein
MSQGEAAARWGVPVSTLGALEQGVVRRYHSQTLARFDAMLGRSANAIYEQSDGEADELGTLRDSVRHLEEQVDEVRRLARRVEVDELDALIVGLSAGQRARVADFIRGMLAAE